MGLIYTGKQDRKYRAARRTRAGKDKRLGNHFPILNEDELLAVSTIKAFSLTQPGLCRIALLASPADANARGNQMKKWVKQAIKYEAPG
jgi:hypothetical protein